MKRIAVINGPNLDRLGKREPSIYGRETLADIERKLRAEVAKEQAELTFFQSNSEGDLIDHIASEVDAGCKGLVINAGAYTHTSIALRDAIAAAGIPAIEVHISNVHAREGFRHQSMLAPVCRGTIAGLGSAGYLYAVRFLIDSV